VVAAYRSGGMTLKKLLLVLVAAAMLADLVSFWAMQHVVWVGGQEQNPVMLWMYLNVGGLFGVGLLKVGLTTVLLLLVSRLSRRWMLVSGASVAIFFGLLGVFGNVRMWLGTLG
jgi:hypothetical protein